MSNEYYHAARAILWNDTDNGFSERRAMKLEAAMADTLNGSCAGFVKEVTEGVIQVMGGCDIKDVIAESAMVYGMLVAFQREWGPEPTGVISPEEMMMLAEHNLEQIR